MKSGTEQLREAVLSLVPLFMVFFAIAVMPHARAAETPVSVSIAPDTLYAGERALCTIRISHPRGTSVAVELPDSAALGPFILLGRKQQSNSLSPSTTEDRIELELAVFGSGAQQLPLFTVITFDAGGSVAGRQEFRSAKELFVKSFTPHDMLQLRSFKPPVQPGFPILLVLPVLFGLLAIASAVLLALFLIKRKVRIFAEAVDPSQVANRKLRKLDSRLSSGMPPSECYAELSAIMREYLERHYHIPALEAVTQEIERDLRKLGVSSFEAIMTLLRQADLVKFADSRPSEEESRSSIRKAGEIVRAPAKGGED